MKILLLFFPLFLFIPQEWEQVSDTGPEPRYINQLAFAENSLLLFGGKNGDNKGFDDLWEWSNDKWRLLGNGATKRWDHSYVYMANHDQIFLFGGRLFKDIQGQEERVDLNDNWIYKNNKWENLLIESPEPRSSHSLAFHRNNGRVILFGGRNKNEVFADTWSFDGSAWLKLDVEGPSKRYGHSLSYNSVSQKIFLFGGFDGEKLLNNLWTFDGAEWTEISSEIKPSSRMAHAMQFDHQGNAVLFGGWDDSNAVSGDVWVWKNEEWELLDFETKPEARLSCAMGYDSSTKEFILFGGSTGFNGEFLPETWKLSLSQTN